jgi:hypothetical protein
MILPDTLRPAIRAQAMASGILPPEHIDEIVDLALHAAQSAIETCERIALDTPPDPRVALSAISMAMGLLAAFAGAATDAARETTLSMGGRVVDAMVQL